jgi:hypothetical protein
MGIYHPILMHSGTQTKKNMLSSKFTIPEMTIKFQDGRRRPFRNSSACYKMGNYHPILMQIGAQTKKNILGSKFRKAGMIDRFQDGRRRHVGTSMLRNYHRTRWKLVRWLSKIC